MHAVIRRVPAERALHAKRIPAIVTTTQTATTPTVSPSQTPSTIQSSTSSLSASSATRPSSVSSSATTLSTSTSSPSSSGTQTPTLSASSSITPTISTYTYTSSPSSIPTNTTAVTHSGLSGGAIAGIIAGAVIVGVALIVFLVRKTYLRRRERKRISWNGAPGLGAGIPDEPTFPDISERLVSDLPPHPGAPLSPFEAHGQSVYSTPIPMQPPIMPSYGVPAPPPATYNNPAQVAAYPTQPVPSTYNRVGNTAPYTPGFMAAGIPPPVRGQHAPLEAIVKCTFVPTLPDELAITTGERVFLLEQYDDGWSLCANARGEQGMVPRDCLEHAPNQSGIGWRNVARTSSLNPDGTRF